MNETEYVVLVDEQNSVIGTEAKASVHTSHTPLHRGFSVFLFRPDQSLLLQQRSLKKVTWPGEWSNSCCGHPRLNESSVDAAKRRLEYELGITDVQVEVLLPQYRYRAEKAGIVENEICPVMWATSSQNPRINPAEVESIEWVSWTGFLERCTKYPDTLSPWCVEEARLLSRHSKFNDLLKGLHQ